MNSKDLIKTAITGTLTLSGQTSASPGQEAPAAPVPPRPIEEICRQTSEAIDGVGLDQDIIDYLQQLEAQGLVLHCDALFEEDNFSEK